MGSKKTFGYRIRNWGSIYQMNTSRQTFEYPIPDSLMVSKEILEYLVSNRVSVNQINTSGQTPLFLLVTRKGESPQQNNAIEYLLKNGADPNLHSDNCNALVHAIQMKKEKSTFLLLKNGAKVNEIGKEETALHVLFKNHEKYCRPHDGRNTLLTFIHFI